jgi:hypothetical protein
MRIIFMRIAFFGILGNDTQHHSDRSGSCLRRGAEARCFASPYQLIAVLTAVDRNFSADDIGGIVAAQEKDRSGDVGRDAEPIERDARQYNYKALKRSICPLPIGYNYLL